MAINNNQLVVTFSPIEKRHLDNTDDTIDDNGTVYKRAEHNPEGTYYYKYMTLETALQCLTSGTLRFVEPSAWQDKYESRFYEADYSNFSKNPSVSDPLLYATCFSKRKNNEAAWKIYSYGKTGIGSKCVQFEIKRGTLRSNLINNIANYDIYEGEVIYWTQYNIDRLHQRAIKGSANPFYTQFFNHFDIDKYVNLMLLKRDMFRHEQEVRFLLVPKGTTVNRKAKVHRKGGIAVRGDKYDVKVDWNAIINEVRIDSSCSQFEYDLLEREMNNCGIPLSKLRKFDVYGKRKKIKIQ